MPNTLKYHLSKINKEGLDDEKYLVVRDLIEKLWYKIGKDFVPRNCGAIPGLTDHANKLYSTSEASRLFKPLVPKRYLHNHFFWLLESNKSEKVIIDPTGVPIDFFYQKIEAYYGLAEKSVGMHNTVYSIMEDMDASGTQYFPPGFHP